MMFTKNYDFRLKLDILDRLDSRLSGFIRKIMYAYILLPALSATSLFSKL